MTEKLRWGIIGTGRIAGTFAKGLEHSDTGELLAVGSRTQKSADAFGEEYKVERCYGTYEEMSADSDVQAVYVSTPHPMHAEWAIKTAEAGKHVLCEKPIGVNHAQAMAIVEAAHRNDVFLMEAFMYRCHPQTAKLVELIREGTIGTVRMIQTAFSFHAGFNPDGRLFKNDLAGGGILDVGCYATSMSRLVAGAALGQDVAEPLSVKGVGYLGETGVDEYTAAVMKFPGDIIAQVSTGVSLGQDNVVRIYGTNGSILVPTPWIPSREGGDTEIHVSVKGEDKQVIKIATDKWLYGIEADTVARYADQRQAVSPAMTWADTLGNMRALDMWRESIGLEYEMEKAENLTVPVHGRPLAKAADSVMTYGEIAGVGKSVSRLVMGADYQRYMTHASVMMDDYFERGGNAFDSAYIYGGGTSERILGQWVKNRGVREDVVILDKGAHTPYCDPESTASQFVESLERLQMDYVDIYMFHRDNTDVPVGEFVDVINDFIDKGQIKAYGGSNWSIARVEEANAYAEQNGKVGLAAISNNFSLARMVDAVWSGCIAASDPEYRAWLTEKQMPLMPWSSQARGFFVEGRAHPDKQEDPELVRCWYSDDNFQRLERANEMAAKKGVRPINIALAYVLCQPFPTFALIGPRILEETRTSWPALEVELTPDEVKWLNLED